MGTEQEKRFKRALAEAQKLSARMAELQDELTRLFEERYGINYSDLGSDALIDVVDYGQGQALSLDEVDEIMANFGRGVLSDTEGVNHDR